MRQLVVEGVSSAGTLAPSGELASTRALPKAMSVPQICSSEPGPDEALAGEGGNSPKARGRRFGRTQISGRGVTWKLRIESWGVVFEGRPQPQLERYPHSIGIFATHLPMARRAAGGRE